MKDIEIEIEELSTAIESYKDLIGKAYKPFLGDYEFAPIILKMVLPYSIMKSRGKVIVNTRNVYYSPIINEKNILLTEVYTEGNVITPYLLSSEDKAQFNKALNLVMGKEEEIMKDLTNTVKVKLDKVYSMSMYFLASKLKYPEYNSINNYMKNLIDNPETLIRKTIWKKN